MYGIYEITMKRKRRAVHRQKRKGGAMPSLVEQPIVRDCGDEVNELGMKDLEALVTAMGKRLQVEYVEGAIPYLREREPGLWAQLEALDQEESLEALLEYERLFFEGLRRYICSLEEARKAA